MAEILIAGSTGGREHALGQAMDEATKTVAFTHGGNGGTRQLGENKAITGNAEIVQYALESGVELAVVGPEAPLVTGLADDLREAGIPTFGPGRDGARLEASKAYTARFNKAHGIRQPDYEIADNFADAMAFVHEHDADRYVIKADGLAGGKGVILPSSLSQALETVADMMDGSLFGDAGKQIVFQRRLAAAGPEISAFYVLDGQNFTLLPLSQDHKRLLDGDKGPNTGGMGAYTPAGLHEGIDDDELIDDLMDIGERITDGLVKEGIDYRGLVYAGTMRDIERGNQPSVLEINVRFGDPETQVVLAAMRDRGVSTYDLLNSAANGSLDPSVRGRYLGRGLGGAALTVCLAAKGYPLDPEKGKVVRGLDRAYEGVTVYHGGTKYEVGEDAICTSGGRVLYVTATGETIDIAAARAYRAIGEGAINFSGMQYRKDIAWQVRAA